MLKLLDHKLAWSQFMKMGLFLLVGALAACSSPPLSEKHPPVSSLRVVMDNNYPPYVFQNEQGQLQGILIDQWRLWEGRTGVKVEITALPWGDALRRMQAGEFDVIDTIFYTAERARVFDFTDAYARANVRIFFQKNISGIVNAGDLKGFRVAVKDGDADVDYLLERGVTDLVYYDNYEAIVRAAGEKEATIFVIDEPPALYFLYKYGLQEQFRISEPLYGGEFHRAVAKGNAEILTLVKQGFTQISPAEYQAIDNRWFGTGLTSYLQQFTPYMVIGMALALLIILALFIFNQMLQSRVHSRTLELQEALSDLRRSETRFREAIDFFPMPVGIADTQGNILRFNRKFTEYYGYSIEDVPSMAEWMQRAYPDPEYRATVQAHWEKDIASAAQAGTSTSLRERRVTCKDGSQCDVEIATHPVGGLWVASFNNVTGRKLAELALRDSEENYRNLVELSPDTIMVHSGGKVVFINTAGVRMMHAREAAQVLGSAAIDFVHPDMREAVSGRIRGMMREHGGKAVPFEEKFITLDGTVIDVEVLAMPIHYEGKPAIQVVARDITERRHSIEALQQSEKRFRVLAENSADAVMLLNADGTVFYEGPTASRLTGYSPAERLGKSSLDNVHPADLPLIKGTLENLLAVSNSSYTIQFRSVKKDGSTWWTEATAKNLLHEASVKALVVNFRDITERKLADEKLRESEQRYRTLFEQANDAIFLETDDDRIIDANQRACEMLGYTKQELLNMHVSDLIAPEMERESLAIRKELMNFGGRPFESVDIRKDGVRIPVEVTNAILSEHVALSIVRDITERKLAEEELRNSENRFRILFEHAGVGVALLDTSTRRFLQANQKYCDIVGYSREELQRLDFPSITHPDDVQRDLGNMERLKAGEISEFTVEKRYTRKDGKIVWVLLIVSPLFLPGEPPQSHIAVIHDITEKKRTEYALQYSEAEIRKLNSELERRVAERTAQLEVANKELEAFSYSVSHDLRAPLRAIDGFSSIILAEYAPHLDDGGQELLQRIKAEGQRMGQLIDALLSLARMARSEMRNETVDLSAMAQQVVDGLHRSQPSRLVNCMIARDIVVQGDARLLSVALENLLGNAWKFTSRCERASIEFGMERQEDEPVYFVRDDGAGFDLAYADKLFGAFQRLHPSDEFEGTGIGLATVQRIVHRHGGRVWANAEVGKGATFYFTLG